MSKFYANQSSSDSDDYSSSEDEAFTTTATRARPTMFQQSDDEEEVRHVVRSAKEKCWDALQDTIKLMQNACKIRDMSKLIDQFENLVKVYIKHKSVIQKEGTPRFYIKCLVDTEDYVNNLWQDKDARKKMSKPNSKSHATLRQKLKKYMRDFEDEVKSYRENPDLEDVEKGSDSEDEEKEKKVTPKIEAVDFLAEPLKSVDTQQPIKSFDEEESDSDSSYWDSSSDDSSDESDNDAKKTREITAEYFLKTDKKASDKSKKKPRTTQKETKTKKKDENWEQVRSGKKKTSLFEKGVEITVPVAVKKLNDIIMVRGRRSTNRHEQVDLLRELRDVCENNNLGITLRIRITFDMVMAYLDYNNKILDCIKPEPWEEVLLLIEELLTALRANSHILVSDEVTRENENFTDEEAGLRIHANPVSIVEKIHREYIKILQVADAHSTEYVASLRQEARFINIIKQLKSYVENVDKRKQKICATYLLQIEYIYYKYDYKSMDEKNDCEEYEDSTKVMKTLCEYIYKYDDSDRIRTRAILHHIYHHCIHDRWYEARDLMLMSHLQESIHYADVVLQVCYNRTMVQLGLCAFRKGLMKEAHHALVDIQSTSRAKELLAQGLLMQRQGERILPDQEKLEKQRQIPFHMHVNLEQLECVYLVSAMLLEIPYVAAHEFDARRRMISKQFHHQLRVSERQSLLGPADNMREHIVAATKALKMGDYTKCFSLVVNDKMKSKVWNLFHKRDKVIEMLQQKIKEASLCTYLFTYSQFYDNLSLNWLSTRFELDKAACHRVISKLIINEELAASWDEPSSSLVLHKTDPTRLQNMVCQLSEKLQSMVDMNERILEARNGGPGNFQNYRQDGGNRYRQDSTSRSYRQENNNAFQNRSGFQGNRSGFNRQNNFSKNRQYRDGNRNGGNVGSGGNFRNNYYKR